MHGLKLMLHCNPNDVPQPTAVETVVTEACYFGSCPVQGLHDNLGGRRE
jgi:hypothetical protein